MCSWVCHLGIARLLHPLNKYPQCRSLCNCRTLITSSWSCAAEWVSKLVPLDWQGLWSWWSWWWWLWRWWWLQQHVQNGSPWTCKASHHHLPIFLGDNKDSRTHCIPISYNFSVSASTRSNELSAWFQQAYISQSNKTDHVCRSSCPPLSAESNRDD